MPPENLNDWWLGFQAGLDRGDDPYDAARHLRRRISGLDAGERQEFLLAALDTLLVERHAYGVVFFLLEGISDPAFLTEIATRLEPLPALQSDDEESHLADLIRILAAAGEPDLMPPVETYLVKRAMGPQWASVPWAIWPRRPGLFGKAWVRYFVEHDPADWRHTLVIKSFLAEPEAILAIREPLEHESAKAWKALREALLRQAGSPSWLSEGQRDALDRAVK